MSEKEKSYSMDEWNELNKMMVIENENISNFTDKEMNILKTVFISTQEHDWDDLEGVCDTDTDTLENLYNKCIYQQN